MTLTCNCDMPIRAYCDWLRLQGWDCSDMEEEPVAGCYANRISSNDGSGPDSFPENYAIKINRGDGSGYLLGNSSF